MEAAQPSVLGPGPRGRRFRDPRSARRAIGGLRPRDRSPSRSARSACPAWRRCSSARSSERDAKLARDRTPARRRPPGQLPAEGRQFRPRLQKPRQPWSAYALARTANSGTGAAAAAFSNAERLPVSSQLSAGSPSATIMSCRSNSTWKYVISATVAVVGDRRPVHEPLDRHQRVQRRDIHGVIRRQHEIRAPASHRERARRHANRPRDLRIGQPREHQMTPADPSHRARPAGGGHHRVAGPQRFHLHFGARPVAQHPRCACRPRSRR